VITHKFDIIRPNCYCSFIKENLGTRNRNAIFTDKNDLFKHQIVIKFVGKFIFVLNSRIDFFQVSLQIAVSFLFIETLTEYKALNIW
jgi:hypothetical protein